MSDLFQRLRGDFQDEDYRHVYTNAFVDSKIATQIKVLREQREWTQDKLAVETGMRQARVSVLEDVNYSSWSLNTLRRFAKAYDVYVDVEFKEFGSIEGELGRFVRPKLERRAFADDPAFTGRYRAAAVRQHEAERRAEVVNGRHNDSKVVSISEYFARKQEGLTDISCQSAPSKPPYGVDIDASRPPEASSFGSQMAGVGR
jgi:transcriptional regulator with XRE-family HTH domain